MSVTLAIDPREAKLPKWVQERLSDLRDEVRRVKADFEEYADGELPDDADAVANPYDKHPRLAARRGEVVRFNLRRGALDLRITEYERALEVSASQGRPLVVVPRSSNVIRLNLED